MNRVHKLRIDDQLFEANLDSLMESIKGTETVISTQLVKSVMIIFTELVPKKEVNLLVEEIQKRGGAADLLLRDETCSNCRCKPRRKGNE